MYLVFSLEYLSLAIDLSFSIHLGKNSSELDDEIPLKIRILRQMQRVQTEWFSLTEIN